MSAIWFEKSALADLDRSGPLTAVLSVDRMSRVGAVVIPPSGPIDVRMDFARHGDLVLIDAELSGAVSVGCQRCLEPMTLVIDSRLRIALAADEQTGAAAPEDYESVVATDGKIRLVDLVEDEILLGIPFSSRHADGECGPLARELDGMQSATDKSRPFAGLAGMMRDDEN